MPIQTDMIKDVTYLNIKEVLSRILRHPLLQECNLEAAVQYTLDFIGIFGLPAMYEDKEAIIKIENYRGVLPCDLIYIKQVMETCSGVCLRSMTDNFEPMEHYEGRHTAGSVVYKQEMTFKTQNHIIFTSFKDGEIKVSYKAIPVDDDGYPLIINNASYLKALELYIKQEVFTILFDTGKLHASILQNTQQQYGWAAARLKSEFTIPSESEMESISRSWTTLIQRVRDFDNGFRNLGDREYLRQH